MVLKFESLEPGLSRSSAGNSEDPQYTPSTNSVSLFSNDPVLRITLEGFVETLQLAGISGPVILIGRPEPLGEGGQFLVFKQEVIFLGRDGAKYSQVAIKRPRFPSVDGFPMDLASSQVERNLKHMANEVKALTNERLRNHPNIVKIFSWAWDLDYSGSLVLVLELAYEDLESALASDSPPSLSQRVQFCDDVANGLDAIHDADFVHGDLKPANVLVFLEASRPVAKLADFGYSVEHSGHTTTGTVGWQAPEKMASIAADCFSYGLLVWSTILLDGRIPKQAPNQSWIDTAITNLETRRDDLPQDVFVRLLKSVKSLLETDPMERCCHLGPFFANGLKSQEVEQIDVEPWYPHTVYNFVASRFKWEIEPLPGLLLKSLYRRSIQSSKQSTAITPDRMLALALRYTRDLPMKPQDLEGVIQTLLDSSAEGGNIVACALAAKARLKARAVHNTTKIIEWLAIAIGTGSLNARDDLQKINVAATRRAIADFDKRGGYNMAYLNLEGIPPWPSPTDAHEINQLHWLSAFGTIEALRYHLDEYPNIAVNTVSGRHETALYMACARGSWEHVKTLLDTNADPSIKCTASGITCMHWIIAFDMPVCKLAVRGLVEAGAKVDALVSVREDTPFPHYPFVLPAGTPLHWAVATARHEAIKALIDAGASPSIRNGCDPYMYDDRVRWLYAVGGPEAEGCTSPESDCLGLSPLDVAAIHRDPFLFQLLSDRSAIIDANSADEEGFTVLHRLATNQIFRTSRRMAYSPRPFRNIVDLEVLQSIIGAIIKLGGSIEMLTSSAEAAKQKNQRSTDLKKKSYTPLMLAMLEGDTDLVDALLACGADVHTENLSGETALIHTSHRANFEQPDLIKCVQTLVSKGADVNHHSSNGNCALLAASKFKLIEVADFLLCSGACIGETDRKELTATPGRSVFAFFVSIEHGTDEKVFELLKKHILDARNYAKRHGVITGSANDGRTLLHEFASSAMPKCVEFLLQNGAHVNALQRETRFVPKNSDNAKKRVWYETPWDALKVTKEFAQDRMLARNSLSLQETVDVQIRWDTCQELLEKYGGAPCTEPAHYEAYT